MGRSRPASCGEFEIAGEVKETTRAREAEEGLTLNNDDSDRCSGPAISQLRCQESVGEKHGSHKRAAQEQLILNMYLYFVLISSDGSLPSLPRKQTDIDPAYFSQYEHR